MTEEKTRLIGLDRSIIPACDIKTLEQLAKVVDACKGFDRVRAYKIGFSLGLRFGLPVVVAAVKSRHIGAKVIYDHQKASTDIPGTGAEFADTMKFGGVDAAILFPQSGPVTESAYIDALHKAGVHVIVGGEMTHQGYLVGDGGFLSDDAPKKMYGEAAQHGVVDFVVPGNKPDRIAEYREFLVKEHHVTPILYSPGFVKQGGKITDSANAAGPFWHAIVGGAVYNPNNRPNFDDVTVEEIRASLEQLVSKL
jgi:orotidine-5'-phosphate decarboxylase